VKLAIALAAALNVLASCVPNTPAIAPDAHLPAGYRGQAFPAEASLATIPWQKFYNDPELQRLIAAALVKNNTVGEAYAAVLEAQANLAGVAGNQQPQAGLNVQAPYGVNFGKKNDASPGTEFLPAASVSVSYQIDLFGKLASATAAARAQLLSSMAAQETVRWTLVSQVATAYFQLRELDASLEITLRTIKDREEDVRLTKLRVDLGENSIQDLYQSQQALYQATQELPLIRQSVAQSENALSVLTGAYPDTVPRGLPLEKQITMPAVPPTGLPSELLRRRPDIAQAEYNLIAADANIDVARKEFYPSLALGASVGVSGSRVTGVNLPSYLGPLANINGTFYGPTGLFTLVPQLTQTIFSGGRLQANLAGAKARQQQLVYAYLQTVLTADEEVANNIAAYNQQRAYREQVQLNEETSAASVRVAFERYNQGETSYLEVLNAQTAQYTAELSLEQARLGERLALVQLYLALGGGWET
jgi:multidrug efflux system outer membrane protein